MKPNGKCSQNHSATLQSLIFTPQRKSPEGLCPISIQRKHKHGKEPARCGGPDRRCEVRGRGQRCVGHPSWCRRGDLCSFSVTLKSTGIDRPTCFCSAERRVFSSSCCATKIPIMSGGRTKEPQASVRQRRRSVRVIHLSPTPTPHPTPPPFVFIRWMFQRLHHVLPLSPLPPPPPPPPPTPPE